MKNVYSLRGNVCLSAPFTIKDLQNAYASAKDKVTKRPWAHFSKAGPGRKHQQGKALTKQQRKELE